MKFDGVLSLFFHIEVNVCRLLLSFAQWMCLCVCERVSASETQLSRQMVSNSGCCSSTAPRIKPANRIIFVSIIPNRSICCLQHGTPEFKLPWIFSRIFPFRGCFNAIAYGLSLKRCLCIQPFRIVLIARCTQFKFYGATNRSIFNIIKQTMGICSSLVTCLFVCAYAFNLFWLHFSHWILANRLQAVDVCMIRFGQDFFSLPNFLISLL